MERIETSLDKEYKIKPGAIFPSKRTGNLRYIDAEGSNAMLVPMSRYYASCDIKRGTPVSICQPTDPICTDAEGKTIVTLTEKENDYPFVKPTNPDVDTNCIGIATNYAKAGQIVQIQSRGRFDYLTNKSNYWNNEANRDKEVFINVESDVWNWENMRAQTLYVRKVDDSINNDHPAKSDALNDICPITFDFIDSVYAVKNTIQIGHLTDAPLTNGVIRDHITVELNVTGDTRGPLQHTQQILKLGEDIYFSKVTADQTLTEPYNNEGILDEVKAVAIATQGPTKASFGFVSKTLQNTFATEKSFIGVRKLDGNAVIITNGWEGSMVNLQAKVIDENDVGYVRLVNSFETKNVTFKQANFTSLSAIVTAIKEALGTLSPEVFGNSVIDSTDQDSKELVLTAEKPAGYFDIYASADMLKYVSFKTYNHGSSAKAGTAVLADIRDANRCNVVGVVLSNHPGVHTAGSDITVMKLGAFPTVGNLKLGSEYFLGLEGKISTRKEYWYDTNVSIGFAETEHNLLVDVQSVRKEFDGNMAIGALKPCRGGVAEKGFLLTGQSYDKDIYPDLYNALLNVYSSAELNLHSVKVNEQTKEVFDIPAAYVGGELAQIKYTTGGIYNKLPRAPFLRKSGNIVEGKIADIDVTSLVIYGTLEQARVAPSLENIDIRLFYREKTSQVTADDSLVWRELQPGFELYNNEQLYGFEWIVKTNDKEGLDGVYTLHCNIGDGLGICKLTGSTGPVQLNNVEFKVAIAGKNLWEREFNLLEQAEVAHSMEIDSNDLAPSVNTVREYYREGVDTKHLKAEDANIEEAVVGSIKIKHDDVEVDIEAALNQKEEDFKAHAGLDCNEPAKNEDGSVKKDASGNVIPSAHGLYNAGAEGNLDAHWLDGMIALSGSLNKTGELDSNTVKTEFGYIPFVKVDKNADTNSRTTFETGVNIGRFDEKGKAVFGDSVEASYTKGYLRNIDFEITAGIPSKYIETLGIGEDVVTTIDLTNSGELDVSMKAEERLTKLTVDKLKTDVLIMNDGNKDVEVGYLDITNGSSVAYKENFVEYFTSDVNSLLGSTLTSKLKKDLSGNPVDPLNMSNPTIARNVILNNTINVFGDEFKNVTEKEKLAFDKFGSALQALYELPLSEFDYKEGGYKKQLGILVERVNQVRDAFANNTFHPYHKINTFLQSTNANVFDKTTGIGSLYENNVNKDKEALFNENAYTYTEEEAASIAKYLNLVTGKKELNMEVRTIVGMLLKAAQESQERLLDIESAVYGFDAKTIPGDPVDVLANVEAGLQPIFNNGPLLLGLNRLMRVICLELFDTTDLEKLEGEVQNILGDSDSLHDKLTVKTRIDKVDELVTELMKDVNAVSDYVAKLVEQNEFLFDEILNVTDVEEVATTCAEADRSLAETKKEKSDTWGNLPSSEDYNTSAEIETTLGSLSTKTGKHIPEKSETYLLKVPKTEDNPNAAGLKRLARKPDGSIVYDYKVVAPLAKKVERINKKLSRVTEAIYGEDEVLYADPNRILVLEKNVENLIDILYPNKNFKSTVAGEGNLKLPFMNVSSGNKPLNGFGSVETYANKNAMTYKKNAIDYLMTELYNFEFNMPIEYASDKVATIFNKDYSTSDNFVQEGSRYKISSNVDSFSTDGTSTPLDKAKTVIDYIGEVIGLSGTLNIGTLNDITAWLPTAFKADATAMKTNFTDEDKFYKDIATSEITTNTIKPADTNFTKSTLVDATKLENVDKFVWLSRKSKTLSNRIAAVETELDLITKAVDSNGRGFEERNIKGRVEQVIELADNAEHSSLNLWLEDLSKYEQFNIDHNQKLLNFLENYCEFKSEGNYDGTTHKKVLKFKLVKNKLTHTKDNNIEADVFGTLTKGDEFEVTVEYVNVEVDTPAVRSLYVKRKGGASEKAIEALLSDSSASVTNDINFARSQAASAELDLMKQLMKENLQATYDIKYPVGSIVYADTLEIEGYATTKKPYGTKDVELYQKYNITERTFEVLSQNDTTVNYLPSTTIKVTSVGSGTGGDVTIDNNGKKVADASSVESNLINVEKAGANRAITALVNAGVLNKNGITTGDTTYTYYNTGNLVEKYKLPTISIKSENFQKSKIQDIAYWLNDKNFQETDSSKKVHKYTYSVDDAGRLCQHDDQTNNEQAISIPNIQLNNLLYLNAGKVFCKYNTEVTRTSTIESNLGTNKDSITFYIEPNNNKVTLTDFKPKTQVKLTYSYLDGSKVTEYVSGNYLTTQALYTYLYEREAVGSTTMSKLSDSNISKTGYNVLTALNAIECSPELKSDDYIEVTFNTITGSQTTRTLTVKSKGSYATVTVTKTGVTINKTLNGYIEDVLAKTYADAPSKYSVEEVGLTGKDDKDEASVIIGNKNVVAFLVKKQGE